MERINVRSRKAKVQAEEKLQAATSIAVPKFSFFTAQREILSGKKLTKETWNDPNIYIQMKDGWLCIHIHKEDGDWHPFLISAEDLIGYDWRVVE